MTAYTALHIVKLLWSWLFQMGSHCRHLSANAWSPVTDSFKWGGPLQDLPIFIYYGYPSAFYICIVLDLAVGVVVLHIYMQCSSMQGLYAWLTGEDLCLIAFCYANIFGIGGFNASMLDWVGVHLPFSYMHCPRSSSGCSGMQGIYAWLTGEDLCWIALCYANIFCVVVFNASMLSWVGDHLPSLYMHCDRSSSGCSGMQGICAWLTGEDLCAIALWYANIFGVAVFNASILDWLGWSICLLYICIVLDLAVGVVVCKASVLVWLGRIYVQLHCGLLIYLV